MRKCIVKVQINYIQQVIFFGYLTFIASTRDLNTYGHTHTHIHTERIILMEMIWVCSASLFITRKASNSE